jgi:putative nucleotidyltransferase with HDIG domain
MTGLLASRLSGWWLRLFGRRKPSLAPDIRRSVEPGPVVVPLTGGPAPATAAPLAEIVPFEAPNDEIQRSFLETVQMQAQEALPPTVQPMVLADQAVRARTLRALDGLSQIPALQSLAQGFVRVSNQMDASVDEVVESIQKDPALCVRVLRMANSAFVSSEQRIEDVPTAVQMLGVLRVRKLALTLFTLRGANKVAEGFDWRHLWIHCFATAAVAEELARLLHFEPDQHLYLAGLLHDVGKIVLSTVAPDEYRQVLVDAWNGDARLQQLELSRLGVDHAEAGQIFAIQNGLPTAVIETVVHHGRPESAMTNRREVALVSIADYICKAYGLGFSGARLDATDGELEDLPAWRVIAEECVQKPDVDELEMPIRKFVTALKPELATLREGL